MQGKNARRLRLLLASCCLVLAACQFAEALYLQAKAQLAQHLIAKAWTQSVADGQPQKPWSWADTWPVAKLSASNGKTLYVLAGTSGQALAFGPGLMDASAAAAQPGTVAIAGHRDSHFAFLEHVQPGEQFTVQFINGTAKQYQVRHTAVVDSRAEQLRFQYHVDELKLISCYPFNALAPQGPLRYVVSATPV